MNDFTQVIQYLANGKVRTFKVIKTNIGTEDDPLTTIEIDGNDFEDIEL